MVAQWAASKALQAVADADLGEALAESGSAGHAARDRLLDRIARSGRADLAPAVRALADPDAACGVPVRTLLALGDSEAVALAGRWLDRRQPQDAEDVGLVVAALVAEGSEAALAAARKVRDSRLFDQQAPLAIAFSVLAGTGAAADAEAAVTAWLQTPPSQWGGEEPACALLAECGLAAVPASWFAAQRRVPQLFEILEQTTDAPLGAALPGEERKELIRHWQKRHVQEVAARLKKATQAEGLPPALAALAGAVQAKVEALARMHHDDASDLLVVLLGAALVSHQVRPDAAAMGPVELAQELARDVRRIDPRATRALIDRAAELGAAVVPALEQLIRTHPGRPGAGLGIAALLRVDAPERLPGLFAAAETPLPQTLIAGVLEVLQGAGPQALPLLQQALADAPPVPTPGLTALIQGAPYRETVDLVLPVLPRWLARSKQRTLAICAILADERLLPVLEDDWVEGADHVAQVIQLIATLAGKPEVAAKYPVNPPKPPSLLRGPDGRPMLPPMRLLLRCVDCDHGYYYEVRQVRITDPNARFMEEDGPPGPPEGLALEETITCKKCGAENRYRFTMEAVQSVRDAMQAEVLMAMEAQMREQQRAAMQAGRGAAPGQGPPGEPPPKLSPGGIILP